MKREELFNLLDKVPTARLQAAAWKATLRLHVWMTGRTHELMLEFGTRARGLILKAGGADGVIDATGMYGVQSEMLRTWGDIWSQWQADFQQARREAAKIAFGVQAVGHARLVAPLLVSCHDRSASSGQLLAESKLTDGVYDPQLRILLNVAEQYVYGDGVTLDARIWKIDRETREDLNLVLMNGIVNKKSAWDLAKEVEQFLGAGQDCPRWTSTRLYGRTKSEIASGDATGLLRGDECDGSGVSYKALRLARTEIQKIHALATDRMMRQQPWVEQEKINLSAAHPEPDECDDAAQGGEKGEGIYPLGTHELPFHPNCLCYKTAVLMDREQFVSQMRGWLDGSEPWSAMDTYASELGVPLDTDLMPAAINLAVWMLDDDFSSIFGARRLGL